MIVWAVSPDTLGDAFVLMLKLAEIPKRRGLISSITEKRTERQKLSD